MEFGATLAALLGDVAAGQDPDRSLQRIVDEAGRLTGGDGAILYLLNEERGRLEKRFSSGRRHESKTVEDLPDTAEHSVRYPIKDRFARVRALLQMDCREGAPDDDEALAFCDLARIVLERREHAVREEALVQIGSA
ncbi:MAG TPA: hypothetical protein VG944_24710, partial [Fimbriimonas sp.]|nr:hypothetical protein [Fimbriimonas sp.]